MKLLKAVGLGLLALVALVVLLGIVAPKKIEVERSIGIGAPNVLVFRHVQYWRNWKTWSPWAAMDTTMKVTVEGKDGSPGSVYKWTARKAGSGEMTNTGVQANAKMDYRLKFIKPFPSESDGYVKVEEEGGQTKVSWGFVGKTPFPWNALNLIMNMDKKIGNDFDRGLSMLKGICEKEVAEASRYRVKEVPFQARAYAVIRKSVGMAQMKEFFGQSYATIMQALGKMGARMSGAPCGLYFTWDEQTGISDMAAAIPVFGGKDLDEIKLLRLPAGKSCEIDYVGPYEKMMGAYTALDLYLSQKGFKQKFPVIEEYLTDPSHEPDPSKWLTKIYFLIE